MVSQSVNTLSKFHKLGKAHHNIVPNNIHKVGKDKWNINFVGTSYQKINIIQAITSGKISEFDFGKGLLGVSNP